MHLLDNEHGQKDDRMEVLRQDYKFPDRLDHICFCLGNTRPKDILKENSTLDSVQPFQIQEAEAEFCIVYKDHEICHQNILKVFYEHIHHRLSSSCS